jgi:8-oxo-dGTP pyrophosphatase MutT (NUDIX family)
VPETRFPAIVKKSEVAISPWVRLVAKEVRHFAEKEADTYHSLAQADYVAVFARTRDERIPIVRQFRPAVEAFTWELPAGIVEAGETAIDTCRRELFEETGLRAASIRHVGEFYPDTGRLENLAHVFAVEVEDTSASATPEPGIDVRFVSRGELSVMIADGTFRSLIHIAAVLLCERDPGR